MDASAIKSRQWHSLRTHVFVRDLYTCQICRCTVVTATGDRGRPDLAVADHIIPRHIRPDLTFDPDNVQTLCKRCHDSTKQADERRGYSNAIGTDGYPTDPDHPFNRHGRGGEKTKANRF